MTVDTHHYKVQFVNVKSGEVLRPDYFPMTHAQACRFKKAHTPHPARRIELYETSQNFCKVNFRSGLIDRKFVTYLVIP